MSFPARRLVVLFIGLFGYGFSMALMVRAGLGLAPWAVLDQGIAVRAGISIGLASALVGVAVLLAWIPLRTRPGVGTVLNVFVVGASIDATLAVVPEIESMPARVAVMLTAVVLNAVSTVLYIGVAMGPGPRDGLMTGLVARSRRSVRLVRTAIEGCVLLAGWLLGGTVGAGTVVYALGIGPLVQMILRFAPARALGAFGAEKPMTTMSECPK